MIIYKATNKINSKIYIGQTIKSLHDRSLEHKSDSKRNNYYFPKAIAKYGFENFSWEIIESCSSQEQLDEKETFWIKELKSQNKNIGYNIASGGNPGKEIGQKNLSDLWKTSEFREKMKLATREGARKLTDEQVGMIKTLNKDGYGAAILCKVFNISNTGIQGIIYNKSWKEILPAKVTNNIHSAIQDILNKKVKNIPRVKNVTFDGYVKQVTNNRILNNDDISKIKYLREDLKLNAKICADAFNVSYSLISKIGTGAFADIQKIQDADLEFKEKEYFTKLKNETNNKFEKYLFLKNSTSNLIKQKKEPSYKNTTLETAGIIKWLYVNGYKNAAVAEALGLKYKTVSGVIYRGDLDKVNVIEPSKEIIDLVKLSQLKLNKQVKQTRINTIIKRRIIDPITVAKVKYLKEKLNISTTLCSLLFKIKREILSSIIHGVSYKDVATYSYDQWNKDELSYYEDLIIKCKNSSSTYSKQVNNDKSNT